MAEVNVGVDRSEYVFSNDEWLLFEESLRPLDPLLEVLSCRYSIRLSRKAAKGWPGRTFQRRKGFRSYILRVTLQPSYFDTGVARWDIHDLWMYDYGEIFRKVISFQELLTGVDRITLENGTAAAVIEAAIKQMAAGK